MHIKHHTGYVSIFQHFFLALLSLYDYLCRHLYIYHASHTSLVQIECNVEYQLTLKTTAKMSSVDKELVDKNRIEQRKLMKSRSGMEISPKMNLSS